MRQYLMALVALAACGDDTAGESPVDVTPHNDGTEGEAESEAESESAGELPECSDIVPCAVGIGCGCRDGNWMCVEMSGLCLPNGACARDTTIEQCAHGCGDDGCLPLLENDCGQCPAERPFCLNGQCVGLVCTEGMDCREGCRCPQIGCVGGVCQTDGSCAFAADEDHDWYSSEVAAYGCELDCDDTDPDAYPNATEFCFDEVDNDCDEAADAEDAGGCTECEGDEDCSINDSECLVFYCGGGHCFATERDDDEDGHSLCGGLPAGEYWDCDDDNAAVNPGQTEACNDVVDNDCDGQTDCEDADCLEACSCTTIETDSETVGVSGAPIITMNMASPCGAAVPGVGEVWRANFGAVCECSDVMISGLQFEAEFSDNDSSGWAPDNLVLYNTATSAVIAGPILGIYEPPGDHPRTMSFNIREDLLLTACETMTISARIDTTGASSMHDDVFRLELVEPVEFVTVTDGAVHEMDDVYGVGCWSAF